MVHRDIKPDNILINPETNEIKLIDFGLGSFIAFDESEDTSFVGTPIYMAPEIISRNQVYQVLQAEIWSIGVTFWQLLTGRCPFRDCKTKPQLLDAISKLRNFTEYSPSAQHILNAMLNLDPAQRPSLFQLHMRMVAQTRPRSTSHRRSTSHTLSQPSSPRSIRNRLNHNEMSLLVPPSRPRARTSSEAESLLPSGLLTSRNHLQ